MLVEVCVQNLEDALLAESEGADRIELCASLETGGITPSAGLIKEVVRNLRIPIHVLVRPRSGDFCYTTSEIFSLFEDIRMARSLGAKGIVTGVVKQDGSIDEDQMARIRSETQGIHLTFHRAFDLVSDPHAAISQLEALGIDTVLSSGQRKRAIDGLPLLLQLKDSVSRTKLMPGGGVSPENIMDFNHADFEAIHFSGSRSISIVDESEKEDRFTVSDLGSSSQLIMQPDVLRKMIRSVK